MSKLVDILIGDIEGRNCEHKFYIVLEDDEYTYNDLGSIVLTEKGKTHYEQRWDTRYYNYAILEVSSEKKCQLITQLNNQIVNIKRDIEVLINYTE